MLWGLSLGLLLVLLQCLIFGFFIGSGKTIKRKVQEAGLSGNWVEKTKEYKNRAYPSLMLSLLLLAAALAAGGAVSVGLLPPWFHGGLMVLALGFNVRSLWISYRTVSENVQAIHQINRQMASQASVMGNSSHSPASSADEIRTAVPARPVATNLYFLAMAVWVPFLYVRWSLGDQVFPFWPFLLISLGLGTLGFWFSIRKRKKN